MQLERVGAIRWMIRPVSSVFEQVPRALVVSGMAAVLDCCTLAALVELAGWHPLAAATVGYLLGGVLQFVLCSVWVFGQTPRNLAVAVAVFFGLSLFGLVITWGTIGLLYDVAHVNYAAAKVVALGLAFVWNFCSRKFLLFQPAV